MEERTRLLSMSQIEILEGYNRRNNVKVFGLPCESHTLGVSMKENGNDAIRKVRRIQQHRCRALRQRYFCSTSVTLVNASQTNHGAFFPESCERKVFTE